MDNLSDATEFNISPIIVIEKSIFLNDRYVKSIQIKLFSNVFVESLILVNKV